MPETQKGAGQGPPPHNNTDTDSTGLPDTQTVVNALMANGHNASMSGVWAFVPSPCHPEKKVRINGGAGLSPYQGFDWWCLENVTTQDPCDQEQIIDALGVRNLFPRAEPSSWEPVDLGPYLRGEIKRPEPTVGMRRSDGLQLIYPGKEHSVIGEMESGKSWFSIACASHEITEGRDVLYIHFEEADPSDTIERLQALGAREDHILRHFRFVGPTRKIHPADIPALLNPVPTLVVLDGVNEAMSLHGQGIREEDGAAEFRRLLIKPFTGVGAATITNDHVVKSAESRGRYALGSVHKGNALSGALILIENAEPFARGQRGASRVYVTKDRPGHLRKFGEPDKRITGKTFMGMLTVDDTRAFVNYTDVKFFAPSDKTDQTASQAALNPDDEKVLAIIRGITERGGVANMRRLRAVCGISGSGVDNAVERLIEAGAITESEGPRRARLFQPAEMDESPPTP